MFFLFLTYCRRNCMQQIFTIIESFKPQNQKWLPVQSTFRYQWFLDILSPNFNHFHKESDSLETNRLNQVDQWPMMFFKCWIKDKINSKTWSEITKFFVIWAFKLYMYSFKLINFSRNASIKSPKNGLENWQNSAWS